MCALSLDYASTDALKYFQSITHAQMDGWVCRLCWACLMVSGIIVLAAPFIRLSALMLALHLSIPDDKSGSRLERMRNVPSQWAERLRRGSSAFCDGESGSTRTCQFGNLCYFSEHDEFVLLHGPRSLFSGLPSDREAFLDMSSVSDHNTQQFEFVDLPVSALFDEIGQFRQPVKFHVGVSVIFKRFNPGNLMHVIHDDLLPLYLTQLKHQTTGSERLQLVAADDHPQSPLRKLYETLSRSPVILKAGLKENHVTCFESAIVGLPKETTWYQYGFSTMQGPINSTHANGKLIRQFASWIKRSLRINQTSHSNSTKDIVLLSRSVNRVILNEEQLVDSLQQMLNGKVHVLPVETTPVVNLIKHVSHADILIGMHGGSMALAAFLAPNSAMVEVFPYAVPAEAYTPYKTLVGLPGMNISYGAWENKWNENTVTHPEYPANFGGISHLSASEQEHIMRSSRVGAHVCCSNPEWLFRIYQDTYIDISSALDVVQKTWQATFRFTKPTS